LLKTVALLQFVEEIIDDEEIIRIISARKATTSEAKKYSDNRKNGKRIE